MRTPSNDTRQLSLFGTEPVEAITDVSIFVETSENQWFDRKSVRINPVDLAKVMIAFANADGGRVVVGIHSGVIEGIASLPSIKLNDFIQAGRDFADPPVRNSIHYLNCINSQGIADQILILDVEASETIHRNQRSECYLRVGDETRLITGVEERELAFDKGEANYDKTIVPDLTLDDLDLDMVKFYSTRLKTKDLSNLMRSRGIYLDRGLRVGVTQAGQLLFGKDTPLWSYIRYQRYDGTVIETGSRSNLRADVRLEGTIPEILRQAQDLLRQEIGTVIRLGNTGRFAPTPVLPEYAWLECVVNALTHRSYSLHGDGIHVRQFSDRLEIQSPGRLPGLVRVENIRNVRFSRNPHVARILAEMTDYVRELNEGVPRMFQEMRKAGLREPRFRITDATVTVVLYKEVIIQFPEEQNGPPEELLALARGLSNVESVQIRLAKELEIFRDNRPYTAAEMAETLDVTIRTISRDFIVLKDRGLIEAVAYGVYKSLD